MRKMFLIATLMAAVATPAAAMDCGAMLDSHMDAVGKMSKTSAEKRAAMRRMALQGYDYCMAGDTFTAEKFFKMLMERGGG